jgi:hypothetical protein
MELFAIPSDLIEEAKESVQRNSVIAISKEDRLLETVLASGNIEVLERYIALREREEARQARILFEANFAQLRAELQPVVKTKINGAFKSKYAPLEDLQAPCDPVILKHGFFYTWREEALPIGKRVWMDISGYGHTRSNSFDALPIDKNSAQNDLQMGGIMSAYGQRYTFKAGFGIVIAGEDSDGNAMPDDTSLLASELRDIMATGKIIPETVEMIKKYLALPEDQWDTKRLQGWVKAARRKAAK